MKFTVLNVLVLSVVSMITSVSTLICYDCPLRQYDFLITPNTVPAFPNCTTTDTKQNFCSLNFYSDDNGKTSKLRANPNRGVERANVSYISAGFDIPKGFGNVISFGILYQCMADNCNNPQTILKRILEASTIETYRPRQSLSVTDLSSSTDPLSCFTFSNFSSIDDCRPPFHSHPSLTAAAETCPTYCVTAIRIDSADLKTERMCSYCERQTIERFSYIDERVHLLDQRVSYLQQLDYICNTTSQCNSLENIRQIQQNYKIEFDFDIFFRESGAAVVVLSGYLQYIGYFLLSLHVVLDNTH